MDKKKVIIGISAVLTAFALFYITYLFIIPFVVTNTGLVNFICKKMPFEVVVESPLLKTKLNSEVTLGAGKIEVKKDDNILLQIDNLQTSFLLNPILTKKLVVNNFALDYLFSDVNGLMELCPQEEVKKEEKPSDFALDLYDSILNVKKAEVIYALDKDTTIKVLAQDLFADNTQKEERYIRFNVLSELNKSNNTLRFEIADNNKVVIKNKHLYINDCLFDVNKSTVHINAEGSRKKGLELNLSSRNFEIEDVTDIVATNLVIANGSEILSYFKDLKGNFDFNINMHKSGMDGTVNLNKASMKIVPLADMPLNVNKGLVKITPKTIDLAGFEGYYGVNSANKVTLEGGVKDYMKSCDTEVVVKTAANNEFAKNYLSKVVGIPLEIVGKAGTQIVIKSIYDKIDVIIGSKLATGDDILVDGASLTPTTYDRAVKADLHIRNNILEIEDINYYIAHEIVRASKVKPVVTLSGKMDISQPIPFVQEFGFDIPNPLPSEFLNVLVGQKLFRGGKFSGELFMINNGHPVIDGKISAEDIRIPSQRVYLKKGELFTDRNAIHLTADARYKRSKINFVGDIKNSLEFPIVVKNIDFSLDKLDVEKIMNSFNQQPQTEVVERDDDDEAVTFDFNNLIIERCMFRLNEGSYKDINFGNLNANLTLDKNNILKLESNKFDIAEGISTIKVNCDLNKHLYYMRLGVKDVNSDLMSTTILNLPKEISGKARGLIELNTDDSLKLNGQIKFEINDGEIPKIGLVQYLMKFVSVFRNPVVMISPSIISDIVSIPDGKFERIYGELFMKDNVISRMKIESTAPSLACLIIGRYNLENSDASLRIYTKFSNKQKGFGSVLRNLSLNSLANKISLSSKADSNYYAAELNMLPKLDADEDDCQVFLTTVDGDVEHNNFLSSLKKLK
ncbi:MAG: hypothetical protein NC408_03115 [Candidatus Gastranaerophilales bacterium]|nr:hypothetical protein [Candidatus Gastranaerophilales bacterium]MCM1073267.1 hypothetical protein [Bacteroides sp.]